MRIGIAIALVVAAAVAPAAVAAPRIVVESTEYDLGTLVKGDVGTARFELRNEGDEPLRLLEVTTGCHCTVASFDSIIAPGDSGIIEAVVDTGELSGEAGRGVTVYTNDPQRPKLFLVIRVTVLQSVSVLPEPTLSLSNRAAVTDRRSVLIRQVPLESAVLNVSDIVTSVPWLSARARRLDGRMPAGDGRPVGLPGDWLLEVDLAEAPLEYGRGTALVRLATGLELQPEIEIPVAIDLAPPVTLSRTAVELAKGSRATLLVAVRSDLDVAGLRIRAEPEGLLVEREDSDERRFKLHLSWDGDPLSDGALTFLVGGEQYAIPVTATR